MENEQTADARVLTRTVGTGGHVLAKVTERVRQLRMINDSAVLTPVRLGVADGDQVVVTVPWVDGIDLAELETRRGPLSAGESVWLGVRVAQALEAMHAQGIAHGDVSPGNIVLTADGVVLVDTVAGCLDDEWGTLGFRAPERESGATPAGDVYSLGALLRWCVADTERTPIEAWTAPLVTSDPDLRPPVQVSAKALASCAREQPIDVPARTEVVSAVRARAADRTVRIAAGRRWRLRKTVIRAGVGLCIAATAAGVAVVMPRIVDTVVPAAPAMAGTAAPAQTVAGDIPAVAMPHVNRSVPPTDPGKAAAALTAQRFAALAAGDGEALLATVGSGPIESETVSLAERLESSELQYEGLSAHIGETNIVDHTSRSAVVVVEYEVSDHRIVHGQHALDVAGYTQQVELELSWSEGWTVVQARPAP